MDDTAEVTEAEDLEAWLSGYWALWQEVDRMMAELLKLSKGSNDRELLPGQADVLRQLRTE